MTALNKQALRYGDNVLWFLNELAAYDASDIDSGEFDVYGEDRNGLEGCSTIDVTELAADAAKLIEAAEKRIAELEARTVTLPDERFRYGESDYDDGFVNGWNAHGIETKLALRAAGIGVKGE